MLMSVVQIHLSPPFFGFKQRQEPSKPALLLGLAGFLLPQVASGRNMTYRQIHGTFDGTL